MSLVGIPPREAMRITDHEELVILQAVAQRAEEIVEQRNENLAVMFHNLLMPSLSNLFGGS